MLPNIGFLDSYSIMIVLGIILCFLFVEIYFRKNKEDKNIISIIELTGIISILSGLIFAILFQNLYDFIENPNNFTWSVKMTFYGGLFGGAVTFILIYFLILKRKYKPFLLKLLIIAPSSITIAHGLGRIGCFLAGCCYGKITSSPLGVHFPGIEGNVYPTNLYEALFLIILSMILLFLAIKKQTILTVPIYLISYGVFRFFIEFLRGDDRGSIYISLSPSQFWSIILVAFGIGLIIYFKTAKSYKKISGKAE